MGSLPRWDDGIWSAGNLKLFGMAWTMCDQRRARHGQSSLDGGSFAAGLPPRDVGCLWEGPQQCIDACDILVRWSFVQYPSEDLHYFGLPDLQETQTTMDTPVEERALDTTGVHRDLNMS